MRTLYRRGVSALLSLLLLAQTAPLSLTASAAGTEPVDVSITQEHFPDPVFRQWLTQAENLNGAGSDGILTEAELSAIRTLDLSGLGLTSLEGIELFPALERLYCAGNQLTELDLRQNTALTALNCSWNQLSRLDLTGLAQLTSLNCENSRLSELILEGCEALETLLAQNNNLTYLDLSGAVSLKLVDLFDNQLASLDLTALTALEFVNLDQNRLTALDLSQNTNLTPAKGFTVQNNLLNTLTLPVRAGMQVSPEAYAQQDPQTGYDRTAWYTDAGYGSPVDGAVEAGGQTLYAKRLPNDYTIRFSGRGGSGGMDPQPAVWDTPLHLSANRFTRRGYTFAGWENAHGDGGVYSDGQKVTNLAGKVQGDTVTLFAQWTPVTYTLAFDGSGGSGSMPSQTLTYDQAAALPACTLAAPADQEFAGWALEAGGPVRYRDGASIRNLSDTQGETVTLYAVWRAPVENQYLERLESAFSRFQAEDYTARDWERLSTLHSGAAGEIAAAVDTGEMEDICAGAEAAMTDVPTLAQRAQAVLTAWRAAYPAVGQADANAVTAGNATQLRQEALDAAAGLTAELAGAVHPDLTAPADREQTAALALELAGGSLAGLDRLEEAAAWAVSLNGLAGQALAEVTSRQASVYEAVVQAAIPHAAQLAPSLTEALELRAALAVRKQLAAAQLQAEYQAYDPDLYSAAGSAALAEVLRDSLSSLESAESAGAVSARLDKALRELAAVPDRDQESGDSSLPFTDVAAADWCYDAVRYVHRRGIMNGYSDGAFAPQRQLSRAQLAQLLYNLEGRPQAESAAGQFADLIPGSWSESALSWAVESGVLSGYQDGLLRPDRSVSRQQLAAMLYRYAQHKGYDTDRRTDLGGFQDAAQSAEYAREALQWAVAMGIVQGTAENTLSPNGAATRAQTAAMLMRFCENPA